MNPLSEFELRTINGGDVPTAFYMDSDVIAQNGKNISAWSVFTGKVVLPFFKEIMKAIFL
jgi:hypothetical protein